MTVEKSNQEEESLEETTAVKQKILHSILLCVGETKQKVINSVVVGLGRFGFILHPHSPEKLKHEKLLYYHLNHYYNTDTETDE